MQFEHQPHMCFEMVHPLPYLSDPDAKCLGIRHIVSADIHDIILHPINIQVHKVLMGRFLFPFRLGTKMVIPRVHTAIKCANPKAHSVNGKTAFFNQCKSQSLPSGWKNVSTKRHCTSLSLFLSRALLSILFQRQTNTVVMLR